MLFPTTFSLYTGLALFGLSLANAAALGAVRDRLEREGSRRWDPRPSRRPG